jgi:hypothetical protein
LLLFWFVLIAGGGFVDPFRRGRGLVRGDHERDRFPVGPAVRSGMAAVADEQRVRPARDDRDAQRGDAVPVLDRERGRYGVLEREAEGALDRVAEPRVGATVGTLSPAPAVVAAVARSAIGEPALSVGGRSAAAGAATPRLAR